MPTPTEVDLTIRHVPYDVFSRLERQAARQGQTIEEFVLEAADHAASPASKSFDAKSWLARSDALRARIARRGPVLNPGETVKDLARMGLHDA